MMHPYSKVVVVVSVVFIHGAVVLVENRFLHRRIEIRVFQVVVFLFLLLKNIQLRSNS